MLTREFFGLSGRSSFDIAARAVRAITSDRRAIMPAMRLVLMVYAMVIVGGLGLYIVVGLTHG